MMKAMLVLRLALETIFGAVCLSSLLLLPGIWSGVFPQLLIVGYLGMPLHYSHPAVARQFNEMSRFAGLLGVTVAALSGVLWFRDVSKLFQELRAEA